MDRRPTNRVGEYEFLLGEFLPGELTTEDPNNPINAPRPHKKYTF